MNSDAEFGEDFRHNSTGSTSGWMSAFKDVPGVYVPCPEETLELSCNRWAVPHESIVKMVKQFSSEAEVLNIFLNDRP